jgi:NAD(P)H-dependent FMN reductase
MQLRMTLSELGMPSIPSLFPIPRIDQALDEAGRPQADWIERSVDRFLREFAWYARALKTERANGTPY